ncbi:MAG: hypothetical protein GY778_07695 [bacterium]|nr:hypothetical protein [bacterium]
MYVLGVIIARAASKGLCDKCVRPLLGRPVIEYTFDHALCARSLATVLLTSDSARAQALAADRGIEVVRRPPELAVDTATVDDAARHAVQVFEERVGRRVDGVCLLYGNIPVRAPGVIDEAVARLAATGADSVRTVAPVSKQHPDWVHRLDGDRMTQYRANGIYRRQDLEPLYYHDGAVAVVTRRALFAAPRWAGDHQGFLGDDRRAVIQQPEDSVDIDGPIDLCLAEALLRSKTESVEPEESDGPYQALWEQLSQPSGDAPGPPDIRIGDRTVGNGQPVYVIAEAGVNHDGSVARALEMIDAAAEAGADAVKFQMFTADALVTADAAAAEYQQARAGARTQREMLRRLELGVDDFATLRRRCADRGVEFLATPFGLADLERLVGLEVRAIKLASTDLNNVPLLQAAAETHLPLIVSTGAGEAGEIATAVADLDRWGAVERTVLLHCVSAYPTPWDQANLGAIGELGRRFGRLSGFSDHTASEATGALAVAAGARVIEKHFTLDRNAEGPDHALSLEPGGLAGYVTGVRHAETAMGSGALAVADCEREVRHLARKSVVASTDIAAGQTITANDVTAKRPGGGLEPRAIDQLIGRRAKVAIAADAQFTWEMLD